MNELPKQRNPYLATDIIINVDGGIILIKRKNFPTGLAVPGGFAEWGLSLEDNAIKEAKEETNLDVEIQSLWTVLSNPNRDPRGHVVSVVFTATVKKESLFLLKAGDDAKEAWIYSLDAVKKAIANNELVFDHAGYLEKYIEHILLMEKLRHR